MGVGGYLLGGGLSVLNSVSGWAVDNILAVDIVLPNGTFVTASENDHPDLFMALKGSGSNFGIVTGFELKLEAPPGDGAVFDVVVLSYPSSQAEWLLKLLSAQAKNAEQDPWTSMSLGLALRPDSEPTLYMSIQCLNRSRTDGIMRPFMDLKPIDILWEEHTQHSFGKLVEESNPKSFCQHKSTFTSRSHAWYATGLLKEWADLFNEVDFEDEAFQAGVLIQPLTVPHIRSGNGNVMGLGLGLGEETDALLLWSFEIKHSYDANSSHDKYAKRVSTLVGSHQEDEMNHPFRYINYASADQDGFAAFKRNEDRWTWLKEAKGKDDPDRWWERWNGGQDGPFKINS